MVLSVKLPNLKLKTRPKQTSEIINYVRSSELYRSVTMAKKKGFVGFSPGANVIKLFIPSFTNFHNKLERLSTASLYSLVYCLWARLGAYPIV
jgi:hypothetical protein